MHLEFAPPDDLKDALKCFWYDRRDFGDVQTSFDVQPDGYAEIIFHFGSLWSLSPNGILDPVPSPLLMGLLDQPAVFYSKGRFEIVAIRCFPWTVFDLLGLPSGEGIRLAEHPIAELRSGLNKLIDAGEIEEAIARVTTYFQDARSHVAIDTMLFKAGVAMSKAKGSIAVRDVADAAHSTVRTLERKFKQSSGHTVKDVSALMRFEQVRNALWLNPESSLAGLAHEVGYADQSHLSRDFKRYSGTTPAAFARKAKLEKSGASKTGY